MLINAAESLEGFALKDGWTVDRKVPDRPGATGGNFSVTYWAHHTSGRRGFAKVVNYQAALHAVDAAVAMQALTEAYLFERDLLQICGRKKLGNVILSLSDGQIRRSEYIIPTVSYLIFEIADNDIRAVLDASSDVESSIKFRSLHHVALGLRQLHGQRVAHQDIKPSNVLVMPPSEANGQRVSKVGDLGRASMQGHPLQHDQFTVAGDKTYAPLEQLYGMRAPDFGRRRTACDLYQLGGLATFMFTGVTFNALMKLELHPSVMWENWTGDYGSALPYVRDAFGRALVRVQGAAPEHIAERLTRLVGGLCDPEPERRRHPALMKRGAFKGDFGLDRYITDLDLLARRAELKMRPAA